MLYFSNIISGIIQGFFWVMLKSIILEFSSIMYLTQPKIGLWQIFQSSNFVLSREKFVTFGFSFRTLVFFPFLGKFERHCL